MKGAAGAARAALVEPLEGRRLLTVTLVSENAAGTGSANAYSTAPAVSADGRFVAFVSGATDLVPGLTVTSPPLTSNVYVRDRWTGTTRLVSAGRDGGTADGGCGSLSISADGRYVAFASNATNLTFDDFNGSSSDVFVRDTWGQSTVRASAKAVDDGNSDGGSAYPMISADGRSVAFMSTATNLVPGVVDRNGRMDVFVRDLRTNVTRMATVALNGQASTQGTGDLYGLPLISADGRRVAFTIAADDLVPGDTNHKPDVFVYDVVAGTTTAVSANQAGTGTGNADAFGEAMTPDGHYVAFRSRASDLTAAARDAFNAGWDVFRRDLQTGQTVLVSATPAGSGGDGSSWLATISDDGRYVAFQTAAWNLVGPGSGGQIVLRDVAQAQSELVSVNAAGTGPGNRFGNWPSMSGDGRYVAFTSDSSDLDAAVRDDNGGYDLFVRDRVVGRTATLTTVPNGSATVSQGAQFASDLVGLVSTRAGVVVFASSSGELVEHDNNFRSDVLAADVPGAPRAAVAGVVFDDRNRNGVRDDGEPGLEGFRVFLDADGDGYFGPGDAGTLSGADGTYRFGGLPPGTYRVGQAPKAGWRLIAPWPGPVEVQLAGGTTAAGPDFANAPPARVVGRYVFYNHSALDGGDAGADSGDDNAIATDKAALLPGQSATFANVTGYSRGINGVMIDVDGLVPGSLPTASDFIFNVGKLATDFLNSTPAPPPSQVQVRLGAGVGGSDRVTIVWPDGAIRDKWLSVYTYANHNTGLADGDAFYFGNLRGETGDAPPSATTARVDSADVLGTRSNSMRGAVDVTSRYDHNRDGRVNVLDVMAIRDAGLGRTLRLIRPLAGSSSVTAMSVALPARSSFAPVARQRLGAAAALLAER